MDEHAIVIRQLCKRYKDVKAVDQFSLDIKRGELISLLGLNGAGKTTLIGMLTGVIKPDAGDAEVLGTSINGDMRPVKCRMNVSPQESAVAPRLTVRENLMLISEIYGKSKMEAKRAAQETIDEFGMAEIADKAAGKLSGGWQRRLSIAMALITGPEILFLDEPTLGLDVLARRELWEMIRKLKRRATILLTTHYLEEAEDLSDRIAIMKKGRLVAVGAKEELMALSNRDKFEDAFVALSAD